MGQQLGREAWVRPVFMEEACWYNNGNRSTKQKTIDNTVYRGETAREISLSRCGEVGSSAQEKQSQKQGQLIFSQRGRLSVGE